METGVKNNKSYYEILNISPSASDDDIRRAYHNLAKKFHPDRNPKSRHIAELRFRLISEAYAQLKTREKRAKYNRSLRLNAENDNIKSGFFSQIGDIFRPARSSKKERT